MELGEKLKQARQEAGLSQRQLCGDFVTRNMLSQIEHGTARPSMDTLRYLAGRLGKPISWFLEEEAAVSSNQLLIAKARSADPMEARQLLKSFRHPDPMLEWEWRYRSCETVLSLAETVLEEGKTAFAKQLLEEAAQFEEAPAQKRRRLLLTAKCGADPAVLADQLPSLDEELMLRAAAALAQENGARASALLLAVEEQGTQHWNLLQGKALMLCQEYSRAAEYLKKMEEMDPEALVLLETCFRELGDFRQAYEYACKQR